MNYYNEWDAKTAAWLSQLIADGLIPNGKVDTRRIKDVSASDLDGFTQCHFFAGIGGWSRALQLAGWPADRPVWTGSCPCQPFSSQGEGNGQADPRHLWPEFSRLIGQRRPPVIFGEQVAAAIGFSWLDGVSADLEEQGYAVGAAVLGAHSIGAPHQRQRLYWLAHTHNAEYRAGTPTHISHAVRERGIKLCGSSGNPWGESDTCHFSNGRTRRIEPGSFPLADGIPARVVRISGYGNAIVPPLAAAFIRASGEALTSLSQV